MAMTDAERQRKRRAKLKAESKKFISVRGNAGEFDERIRVALAIRELALNKKLSPELIELIAKTSETAFPTSETSASEISTRKYINKIVTNYLTGE